MPSLNIHFLKRLKDDYKKFPVFIETGTYIGQTIYEMEPHFSELYTIEISKLYYNRIEKNRPRIQFMLGSSEDVFPELLPSVKKDAIFFLDGHWSSGDTGRGKKDCPLVEELEAIRNYFQHSAIIIIDDYRLFGTGPSNGNYLEDWSCITKDRLLSVIQDRITNVYHMESDMSDNDRLIIHINANQNQSKQKPHKQKMKTYVYDTHTVYVGGTASENWELLDDADPESLFFHLSKFPSPYTILKLNEGVQLTDDIIYNGAYHCLQNSKYASQKHTSVDYTVRSNVKKTETTGECEYISNRKITQIQPFRKIKFQL